MEESPGTPVPGPAPGGLWAPRPKIVPIADRQHQVDAAQYIADHAMEGAVVWVLNRS